MKCKDYEIYVITDGQFYIKKNASGEHSSLWNWNIRTSKPVIGSVIHVYMRGIEKKDFIKQVYDNDIKKLIPVSEFLSNSTETQIRKYLKVFKSKTSAERFINKYIKNINFILCNKKYWSIPRAEQTISNITKDNHLKIIENQLSKDYNFIKNLKIVKIKINNKNKYEFSNNKKPWVSVKEKGTAVQECLRCHIIVKHMPSFSLHKPYGVGGILHMCPMCMIELSKQAETILNSKGEEWVKDVNRERFIHGIAGL